MSQIFCRRERQNTKKEWTEELKLRKEVKFRSFRKDKNSCPKRDQRYDQEVAISFQDYYECRFKSL